MLSIKLKIYTLYVRLIRNKQFFIYKTDELHTTEMDCDLSCVVIYSGSEDNEAEPRVAHVSIAANNIWFGWRPYCTYCACPDTTSQIVARADKAPEFLDLFYLRKI